jgi:hypothetical protein
MNYMIIYCGIPPSNVLFFFILKEGSLNFAIHLPFPLYISVSDN